MNKYDKQYKQKQLRILKDLENIYGNLVDDLVVAASLVSISDKEYFFFKNHSVLKKKADELIKRLGLQLNLYINNQVSNVWALSNEKNDALVDQLFNNKNKVSPIALKSPNLKELEAFKQSKIKGLTLSDRVWNSNANLRAELESSLNAAISKGQSAKSLAKDIKKYLNEPNMRFRRVRDKFGNLAPSKSALQYNPGRGVYRSSYQNALRLARTEINRAYREADWQRWQTLPFVVGYRIVNSNRVHTVCDICRNLAGIYPKSFKFIGWHPQCMCHCESIMCSDSDMDKIIDGQDIKLSQPPMPKEYVEYTGKQANK